MKFAACLNRPLLLMVLAILIGGGPLMAQDVSESHLKAARGAITAVGATDDFDNIILELADRLKGQLYQKNPDMQPEISRIVDETSIGLAGRRADLEREAATIYARAFSEQELNEIAAFYESATGKKLLANGAIVTRELVRAAEIWQVGISRDLAAEVGRKLAELSGAGQAEGAGEEPSEGEAAESD